VSRGRAGDGIPVRACASFPLDAPSDLHDLARAFHAADAAALDAVVRLVTDAVHAGAAGVSTAPAAVVVVPGHLPGSRNEPTLALAQRLVATLGWPRPGDGILVRLAPAPEGRTAVGRLPAEEAATLRWHTGDLPDAGTVVLLDDVVRTGSTLAAAVAAAPVGLRERLLPIAVFRAG
jgi:predicted hotdog family 3-hydroxylacyl-ACP dehydratase